MEEKVEEKFEEKAEQGAEEATESASPERPAEAEQKSIDERVQQELEKVERAEEAMMKRKFPMPRTLTSKERVGGTGDIVVKPIKAADEFSLRIGKYGFTVRKKIALLMALNTVLVGSIVAVNYIVFRDAISIFSSINLIALFIFMFPIVMIKYGEYKKRKEVEELFPVFLRDFVEAIRGGMTIPNALKSVSRNDYKALSPHVKKMAVQLDWGVPVERVLILFSKKVKSKIISRIISSVRESHRFGGSLADTLEALSNTAVEVERLREERRLYLHSQMITGYIIFFVFLAVIIALQTFLVPSMSGLGESGLIGMGAATAARDVASAEQYKMIFRHLILIQGFFAGLAVGKMAEGAVVAGFKHSLFMMFIGSLVFAIAA